MAEPRYIALWAGGGAGRGRTPFAKKCEASGLRTILLASADETINRLTFDDPPADLIFIDSSLFEGVAEGRFELLRRIRAIDPDMPIFLLIGKDDVELYKAAGHNNAEVIRKSELFADGGRNADAFFQKIQKLLQEMRHTYDFEQRMLANRVADRYEEMETERPGTVAYWPFENDLIKRLVKEKEAISRNKPIRALDIGCGTGRCCKEILEASETAQVVGIDFSGRMISVASNNLAPFITAGRCVFYRALAEKLPVHEKYDLIILSFGFPCYSPMAEVLREAHRVLAPDGLVLASIYNHNALAYEYWRGKADENDPERPISTWIDREKGEIWIRAKSPTPSKVYARTLTCSSFSRELRRQDFYIAGYLTFPVLYAVLGCAEIERHRDGQEPEPYGNKQFSNRLWEIDRVLSQRLGNLGFYGLFLASKSQKGPAAIARKMDLNEMKDILNA